jgi:hypothetical protein
MWRGGLNVYCCVRMEENEKIMKTSVTIENNEVKARTGRAQYKFLAS